MKTINSKPKVIFKAIIVVKIFLIVLIFGSLSVYDDRRDDLIGVWRGTYINTRGLNGYEFLIFRDGPDYRAVVQFFPVDGSPANQIPPGSTLNEVRFDASTGILPRCSEVDS